MSLSPKAILLPMMMVLALSACGARDAAPAPVVATDPAPSPAVPVTMPAPAVSAAGKNDPKVINFDGFGPAEFGDDEEHVRQAWGHPLVAGTTAEGSSCYYLNMDPRPDKGIGIAFMFEDGGFTRYDVDTPVHVAPGDIVVGAKSEDVKAKFPGHITEQPAKYVEGGKTLVVTPDDGGDTRLMFDVDAKGIVTAWRIGVPPQIYYVEGCG